MHSDLYHLRTLMEKKSKIKDLKSFHHSVNVIFHDIEAKYYDQLHSEMCDSLQPIYNSFNNILDTHQSNLKILDVGCGTGLSSEMLINTKFRKSIGKMILLDTSSIMLEMAKNRFKNHSIKFDFFNGDIYDLKEKEFDFVIISSVLHHIPDLDFFFRALEDKMKPGGILFHIHDPNGDAIKGKIYLDRAQELREYNLIHNKKISTRIYCKLKNFFFKNIEPNYIFEVNENLLKNNIIHTHLSPQEIWSVTDIHVEGLPYSSNNGISIRTLYTYLQNFKLLDIKSYCFYGVMPSNLPTKYLKHEKELFNSSDLFGRNISCIWKKLE